MTEHAGQLAVDVRGLVKSYSGMQAVRGIDLAIRQGEVFALLGPNGAGKTTTVEILEGYRTRDGGEVSVLGMDPGRQRARLKSRIGIVLQSPGIDRYLTVRETIAMYATFYPRPRPVDEVIHLVGLEEKRSVRVLKLSGGQQRRLDVAIALVGNPELLFLDEPTTGFDPSARHEAWEVIKNLATLGMTVLLTTHYMDEAQFLADRVAVIVAGRIVAEGPPATLGDRDLAKARIRYRPPAGAAPPDGLFAPPGPDGYTEITPDDVVQALHQLTGWAIDHRASLDGLQVTRPSLEDIYLSLTGTPSGDSGGRPAPPAEAKGTHGMNAAALTLSQVRYVNKAYWRNPASAFFAFAYPLMFLVIFTSIFRNSTVQFGARSVNEATYYVPAMVALAVITVCFNNIAVAVTFQRDSGVLKRTNGTPLPSASFFGARILHAVLVSVLLVIITAAFGRAFYNADIPTGAHPGADAGHARRRRGRVLRARVRHLVGHPERRRRRCRSSTRSSCRCCSCPGSSSPLGTTRPLDGLGRPDLPDQALPHRHAGRVPRRPVPLDRRPGSGRLGALPGSSSRSASSAGNREQADAAGSGLGDVSVRRPARRRRAGSRR